MNKLLGKRIYKILSWGVIAFFAALYVSLIFNNNLLTDEAFTMQLISGSVPEIISGTAHDVHPPLYYLFAKAVYTVFGRGIPPQKVLALIPMVLCLVLGPTVAAKQYGEKAGFWYTLFLACVPCTMEFALQVRMYSMCVLFITGAFLWSDRIIRKERAADAAAGNVGSSGPSGGSAHASFGDWSVYVLWMLAAAYTHYFALVAAGFIQLALGWRMKKLKPWLLSSIAMIIGYLPWGWILLRQTLLVTESYWIPPITPEVVYGYFLWAFGLENNPMTAPIFIMLLAALWFAPKRAAVSVTADFEAETDENAPVADGAGTGDAVMDDGGAATARTALLIPILVLFFGVGFSLLTRPIFRDQYLFPCMGLVALYFGIGMQALMGFGEISPSPAFRDPVAIAVTVIVGAFLLYVGAIQYKECFHQEYRSTLVPELEAYFAANLNPGDCIVYNFEVFDFIYEYYFPENDLIYIEDYDPENDYQITYFLDTPYNREFTYEQLVEWGYTMAYCGHMGVEQNEFEVYKMWKTEKQ